MLENSPSKSIYCNYIHISLFGTLKYFFFFFCIREDATALNIKLYLHLGTISMGFIPISAITTSKGMDTLTHLDRSLAKLLSKTHRHLCGLSHHTLNIQRRHHRLPTQEPLFSLLIEPCFVQMSVLPLDINLD